MFKLELEEVEDVSKTSSLWAEKYRPSNLDAFIGSDEILKSSKMWIENKEIPQIFLFGPPGTGKTSLAKLLIKNIPCDSLIINASDENGIESMRNKVQDFAMTSGINDLKIILLDECLDENTPVTVIKDGTEQQIPIKDLDDINNLVKSYNINDNAIEWKPFELYNKGEQEIIEIEFENGETIACTSEHKWYVKDSAGNPIKMKTKDIISNKIENILTISI